MRIGVVLDNEFDHDHRVQKEVKLLTQNGHQVFILCFDFGKTYKEYSNFSVTRISIPKKIKDLLVLLSTNFSFYEKLWSSKISKWILENNLEAIHAHDLYMAKASKNGISASKINIPLTLDLHENYPSAINTYQWATKGWRRWIVTPKKWYKKEEQYLKTADNIVVLSNSFKKELQSKYASLQHTPFYVHPNMPDLESFNNFENSEYEVEFSSNLPTLFYFGVVAKRRGIIQLLNWIEEILKEGNKFHTLIIGPTDKADKAEFEALLSSNTLKKCVTYIQWSDVKYLPAYLKKIDVGLAPFEVNPQHNSGVANKLFQYMYGEIPILATACKAQKELIEQANCGLIYNNFEEFKEKLITLINNRDLRSELGKNGKKNLLELYYKKVDEEFLTIYKK